MEKKIRDYVENIFKKYEYDTHTVDIKEEVISNLLERVNDLLEEGVKRSEAYNKAIDSLGSEEDLINTFNLKRVREYSVNYLAASIALGVSIITYLILGFVFTLWNPGWLVFLLGIMILGTIENKIGVVWLLAVCIYVLIGSFYNDWAMGAVIFGIAAALSAGKDEFIAGIWLLIVTGFLALGFGYGMWHPGWLLFIAGFAITALIVEKSIIAFTWLSAIFAFLYLGFVYDFWNPSWAVFLVAAAITVYLETGRNITEEGKTNE